MLAREARRGPLPLTKIPAAVSFGIPRASPGFSHASGVGGALNRRAGYLWHLSERRNRSSLLGGDCTGFLE